MPVRLRIALGVTAIFTIILVTLSLVLMLYKRQAIRNSVDSHLQEAIVRVAEELGRNEGDWSSALLSELSSAETEELYVDDMLIGLFDEQANLLASSSTKLPEPLAAAMQGLAIGASDTSQFKSERLDGGSAGGHKPRRVICQRFSRTDGSPYVLCAASSDQFAESALDQLFQVFIVLIPIMLVAVGISSWYLAGVALTPLREATKFANQLDPSHLPEHVELHSGLPESRALEIELQQALRRLGDGYASHRRFIANVSHELKTPISVLLAEGQALLFENDIDPRSRGYVESTIEEMSRLGNLVEGFLTLTKVREGAAPTNLQRYPLNELVMDSVEANARYAESEQVTLRPSLDADGPDREIVCDQHLARVAIDNLIRNAIRFSPKDESVEITARCVAGRAHVAVRDHGPGCPPEILEHVFDRFAQSREQRRTGRGTGIGLEIAHGIMELHNGDITVENLPDRGCVFEAWFPIDAGGSPGRQGGDASSSTAEDEGR